MKRPNQSALTGAGPAVASAVIPGLGQIFNRETDKALGVFVVWAISGLGLLAAIPLIGTLAAVVGGGTWLYGVADAYFTARKQKSLPGG